MRMRLRLDEVEDEDEDEDEDEGREVARREIQWVWRTENCSRATNNFFAFFWGIYCT